MSEEHMRTKQGFTLIELLVAMVVFVIVLGGALNFLRAQQRMFIKGADAMGMLQNLTFGADNLHHQIRTAGGNAPDNQPPVVYASPSSFTFNADYASNDPGSFGSVYIDPDAPASEVEAMRVGTPMVVPGSSPNFVYPARDYTADGINSPAETITLYFTDNPETSRSDDFLLMRKVNNNPAEVLIRNVVRDSTNLPFFRYFRLRPPAANRLPQLILVPAANMPMAHAIGEHGTSVDSAGSAQIDSLRSVLVSFKVTNGEIGTRERTERISLNIPLPNMGLRSLKTCGSEPILGQALVAAYDGASGTDQVRLTWARAFDENSGERDVIRYVIWRRKILPLPAEAYGDPLTSIPAGFANYLHVDSQEIEPGAQYEYRLAAQDCSPKLSSTVTSTVIIPGP
jgi:prepilin-type N-terminal cleavage/methylation domain-containing protein